MIELRVLGPDDWRVWREPRSAALADAPEAFEATLADWQGDHDVEQRWRTRLSIAGSHNVVALGDRPVGMVSGVPGGLGVVELISLWVSPSERGHGVGDRLVEEIVRWARESGAAAVGTRVIAENRAALALYERHGFRDSGESAGPGRVVLKAVLRRESPSR